MAGKRRKGGRGGKKGGGKAHVDNRVSFEDVVKRNEQFENYYNNLNIVPEGPEREQFWETYRTPLPNAFRFTGSRHHAQAVRKNLLERYFPMLEGTLHEGKPVELPKPIPWYPDQLAYSMTTAKNVIRKDPKFKEFHTFLVSETEVGNVSRQEQVSMIPPLFLDVQPHHAVLDMCAAPGSKTAQLIESIHAGEEQRVADALKAAKSGKMSELQDGGRATGVLVANDVNYKRANMLIHQIKRLNSPNIIITSHDASQFPSLSLLPDPARPTQGRYLKYDRILADVPCSGDGTARKSPNIWQDWSPANALGLHNLQVRILIRSLQLLKSGGRVVYSTCSLNPIENEAVIGAAIERCGGFSKVNIIDCADQLPELKRAQGLTTWPVMMKDGQTFDSYDAAVNSGSDPNRLSKLVPSMWPQLSAEDSESLKRCMRVYPHHQDTGGFFITVLEKLEEIRARPEKEGEPSNGEQRASNGENEKQDLKRKAAELEADDAEEAVKRLKQDAATNEPQSESTPLETKSETVQTSTSSVTNGTAAPASTGNEAATKSHQGHGEAFKYLSSDREELEHIYKFYQLHESFPRDRFLVRNHAGEPAKGMYYTCELAKEILQRNEHKHGMKFVHAGVKMFMKQDAQRQENICRWRIQAEGMPIIEGWVGDDRAVTLWRRSTLRKLLIEAFPKIGGAEGSEGWRELGEVGPQVKDLAMGCCILRVVVGGDPNKSAESTNSDEGFDEPLVVPLWRSLYSMNLMLPKQERAALLLRIFNEKAQLENVPHLKNESNGGSSAAGAQAAQPDEEDDESGVQIANDAEETADNEVMQDTVAGDEDPVGVEE